MTEEKDLEESICVDVNWNSGGLIRIDWY